jgi:hypothetical protein
VNENGTLSLITTTIIFITSGCHTIVMICSERQLVALLARKQQRSAENNWLLLYPLAINHAPPKDLHD